MSSKIISIKNTDALKKFNSGGGEGTIFFGNNGKLLKIYDAETNQDSERINDRLQKLCADGIYDGLSYFCAIPEAMIEQAETQKVIGFQMNHFKEFNALSSLLSKEFCVENKITIRKIGTIFLAIHDAVSKIHSKGFIIGDLNYENIMFKFENKSVRLAFVDVDSWAIRKNGINLPATSTTHTICHPEIEDDLSFLQKHHDWYSFAVLLAQSLIKDDPFNLGVLDTNTMCAIKGERQKNGITCWDPRVTLQREQAVYTKRFGKKLTEKLEEWLKGNQKGIFPKAVIEEFLNGLAMCKGSLQGKNCVLEVHTDHAHCTRCGQKLVQPRPRAIRDHSSNQKMSGSDLLDFICKTKK